MYKETLPPNIQKSFRKNWRDLTPEEQNRIKQKQKIKDDKIELITKQRALNIISNDSEDKLYSILILCANNSSFIKQQWKLLLEELDTKFIIFEHLIDEYKVYYLGTELSQVYPFRITGTIEDQLRSIVITWSI